LSQTNGVRPPDVLPLAQSHGFRAAHAYNDHHQYLYDLLLRGRRQPPVVTHPSRTNI